jgi:hypothetical protein
MSCVLINSNSSGEVEPVDIVNKATKQQFSSNVVFVLPFSSKPVFLKSN